MNAQPIKKSFIVANVLVMCLSFGSSLQAVTVWTNQAVGNWNEAINWDTGLVPTSDAVRINVGTAILTNDAPDITSLQLGQDSGMSQLYIGANLTIANNIIGIGSSTFAATNSVIQTNGTVTVVGSTTSFVFTNGTYDISGGVLAINNNKRLDVSGTLKISGTGAVYVGGGTTSTPRFAALEGQTGIGIQTGGTLTAGGSFFIGNRGVGIYDMSGGALWASNNFSVGSSSIGPGNGTLTQSGGDIIVGSDIANSGQTFIGQAGPGAFNLSGGTFKSRSFSIGQGAGITGTVNQTGGTIDLLSGPAGAGSLGIGVGGTGVYSIENGTFQAVNLTLTNATVDVKSNATINCTGSLAMGAPAVINFDFSSTGVSTMNFGGAATIDPAATINVDGSAYSGGSATFTLISATAFDQTPVINLTGFALAATHNWDLATGEFTVTVGTPNPTLQYSLNGTTLELTWSGDYLGWYAQSNSVNVADANQWFDIANSQNVTNLSIAIDPPSANVFYRLRKSLP